MYAYIFKRERERKQTTPTKKPQNNDEVNNKKLASFWYPEHVKCTIPELSKQVASEMEERKKREGEKQTKLICHIIIQKEAF